MKAITINATTVLYGICALIVLYVIYSQGCKNYKVIRTDKKIELLKERSALIEQDRVSLREKEIYDSGRASVAIELSDRATKEIISFEENKKEKTIILNKKAQQQHETINNIPNNSTRIREIDLILTEAYN